VPGAIRSGLTRASPPDELTGPRLEKAMTSLALSAPELPVPQPSMPVCRTFSPAPMVIMFLAVPGLPTVPALDPPLPAEKTTVICCKRDVPVCASRTMVSYACALLS
jgi:hypothetical protein